jgi:hypothetical protein
VGLIQDYRGAKWGRGQGREDTKRAMGVRAMCDVGQDVVAVASLQLMELVRDAQADVPGDDVARLLVGMRVNRQIAASAGPCASVRRERPGRT